jgi:hypothetical protein
MSTLAPTADLRAPALWFSKLPMMLAMPSNSSTAMTGKAAPSRSVRIVSQAPAWALVGTAAAVSEADAAVSEEDTAEEALAAAVDSATEAAVGMAAVAAAAASMLVPPFPRTLLPTTPLLASRSAKQSMFAM